MIIRKKGNETKNPHTLYYQTESQKKEKIHEF